MRDLDGSFTVAHLDRRKAALPGSGLLVGAVGARRAHLEDPPVAGQRRGVVPAACDLQEEETARRSDE